MYGSKTESEFVKSWGIGLAMENATGFEDILKESWKALLTLVLLDLVIVGPERWMETHLDFLSVQGTLLGAGGSTFQCAPHPLLLAARASSSPRSAVSPR